MSERTINIQIPRKLKPFVSQKKRFKVAYGGRGGGKSVTFAKVFIMLASQGELIGCFREYQNSISDSVHSLIDSQIKEMGIGGFQVNKTEIDHISGGGFRFRGLSRSIDAVKSMHGFNYFWLEEGQFISAESLKTLTPTLREEGSELWVSANAMSSADPFSKRFLMGDGKENHLSASGEYEDDLHLIVKINHSDNPWFPATLEQERQHDYATLPRAVYDHVWEGAFNDSVDDNIITAEWFDAAINAHERLGFKPTGATVVSHDPSDLGTDDKGLVVRRGVYVEKAISRDFGDVNEGMDWALDIAIESMADMFVWDCDGIGLGLKQQVNTALNGKKIEARQFRGSGAPDLPKMIYLPVSNDTGRQISNEDYFRNRRAQRYWSLKDRFQRTYQAVEKGVYHDPETLISINPNIEQIQLLRSEVCRIPRKYNSLGKIQILSKPEMRKLKIQSPNMADSLMMSEEPADPAAFEDNEPIKFTSYY